jgi:hypothetical protein
MKLSPISLRLHLATLLGWLIGLAWLAACINPVPATPTEGVLPTAIAGADNMIQATGTVHLDPTILPTVGKDPSQVLQESVPSGDTGQAGKNRPKYLLEAVLDYDRHTVTVQETITYTNRTENPLVDLLLVVEPMNYLNVFKLNKITWQDGTLLLNIYWEGHVARITLPQPLEAGHSLQLKLDYLLNLPDSTSFPPGTRPVPFGFSQRQANLVDWYPYIAVYHPEQGWVAHPPSYYGEHQVYEKADFEVRFEVHSILPQITVAASAPVLSSASDQGQAGKYIYHYLAENMRSFALSISHQYQVFHHQMGDITLLSYTFPYHNEAGKRALQVTTQSVQLYQELFGSYPHPSLSVVEADFLDGMEYDGLFFLSNGFYNLYSGSPADYLTAIAAHETAHQWWYGVVGNDQAYEPWLDEALSTYCERLYYEYYYPEDLDWWWTYRVNYYQPSGWVNTTIYNPEGAAAPYQYYRNAVYLNGALFFEDLRKSIGDQAFFSFLKDYARVNQGKISSTNSFFELLSQFTSQDLSKLISQYFKPY